MVTQWLAAGAQECAPSEAVAAASRPKPYLLLATPNPPHFVVHCTMRASASVAVLLHRLAASTAPARVEARWLGLRCAASALQHTERRSELLSTPPDPGAELAWRAYGTTAAEAAASGGAAVTSREWVLHQYTQGHFESAARCSPYGGSTEQPMEAFDLAAAAAQLEQGERFKRDAHVRRKEGHRQGATELQEQAPALLMCDASMLFQLQPTSLLQPDRFCHCFMPPLLRRAGQPHRAAWRREPGGDAPHGPAGCCPGR